MTNKEHLINLSKENGIDIIGFTSLERTQEEITREKELKELGYLTPFYKEYDEEEYKEYKSAVVIGVSYYNEKIEELDSLPKETAYFSPSSWGEDYHVVLKRKLEPLKKYLENNGKKALVCVDNNSLNERYLGYKAGLGFFGINGHLINDELGSYFFIGILLTDEEFEYDKPLINSCISCMGCVNECPAGAIDIDGKVNGNKCLSYITQKKELTEEESKLINKCIYGCDICSRVCPHNFGLKHSNNFEPLGIEFIDINKYESLSNKEFQEKYGKLSGAWRGKKVIERNIALYKEKLEKTSTK